MSYPITRVVVKDNPPPNRVMTIGRIHTEPETVFKTHNPVVDRETRIAELEAELEDLKSVDEDRVETKVVRGRRPAQPKATEGAETK